MLGSDFIAIIEKYLPSLQPNCPMHLASSMRWRDHSHWPPVPYIHRKFVYICYVQEGNHTSSSSKPLYLLLCLLKCHFLTQGPPAGRIPWYSIKPLSALEQQTYSYRPKLRVECKTALGSVALFFLPKMVDLKKHMIQLQVNGWGFNDILTAWAALVTSFFRHVYNNLYITRAPSHRYHTM